jgi:hypothetical protein
MSKAALGKIIKDKYMAQRSLDPPPLDNDCSRLPPNGRAAACRRHGTSRHRHRQRLLMSMVAAGVVDFAFLSFLAVCTLHGLELLPAPDRI